MLNESPPPTQPISTIPHGMHSEPDLELQQNPTVAPQGLQLTRSSPIQHQRNIRVQEPHCHNIATKVQSPYSHRALFRMYFQRMLRNGRSLSIPHQVLVRPPPYPTAPPNAGKYQQPVPREMGSCILIVS